MAYDIWVRPEPAMPGLSSMASAFLVRRRQVWKTSSRVAAFYKLQQLFCRETLQAALKHTHFAYSRLNLLLHVSVSVRSINVTKSASQRDSQRLALTDLRCHLVWRDIIHPQDLFCENGLLYIFQSAELACLWFWNNKWRTLALVVLFNA